LTLLLLRLQSEAVEKSKPLFQSAVQHYEAAIQLLPEDERSKPIKQQVAGVSLHSMYTLLSVLPVLFCLYVWLA
jgi:Fe2+ transport system protein B